MTRAAGLDAPFASSLRLYPERQRPRDGWFDRLERSLGGAVAARLQPSARRFERIVALTEAQGRAAATLSGGKIREAAREIGKELRGGGFREPAVARAFALVREVATRSVGMRHFDVQLIGGWVLLQGKVAEMETGEGKTLVATLPACTAALSGVPVHVITVNDYLAARDAEAMGPIYEALGLSVGTIVHGMSPEEKQAAYRCDVTYCTNKEVAFDYLRDRIVLGNRNSPVRLQLERLSGARCRASRLLLRGLYYAIVDEADSVLVDEARTPLIIAGEGEAAEERRLFQEALELATTLERGPDYRVDLRTRSVELTPAGRRRVQELASGLGPFWAGRHRREELARMAVVAHELYTLDKDYLVQDGKVQIVDEYTGRLMGDRSWEGGLHQLIETKEGCELTDVKETVARISYQRFFRRYLRLAGMSGTVREIAGELWSVYGLRVVRIPTNRPLRRRYLPDRIHATEERKWAAVVERVGELHREGRPVLVGTRAVCASEHLSRLLEGAGLPHVVLNARQDREEAQIVERAGQAGQITVATNMAGRGTDIRLGRGVAELGGLHVIATELHEAQRIDRQLFGRCARQGEPGSCEVIASLDDEIARSHGPRFARRLAALTRGRIGWPARAVQRAAQARAERLHARIRRNVLKADEQLESALAFSGRPE